MQIDGPFLSPKTKKDTRWVSFGLWKGYKKDIFKSFLMNLSSRMIPYQACGLDKKSRLQLPFLAFATLQFPYIAKAKGVHMGRPKLVLPSNFDEVLALYFKKEINCNVAAEMVGMPISTFFKYLSIAKRQMVLVN